MKKAENHVKIQSSKAEKIDETRNSCYFSDQQGVFDKNLQFYQARLLSYLHSLKIGQQQSLFSILQHVDRAW